jgi:type I restriction enzyme S subunit
MLRKPSTVNQDIRTISTGDECSALWLMQYLKAHSKNLLLEYGKTGTTVESIDFAKMKSMPIMLPQPSEQKAIGNLFQQLDSLITLHQRKHDQLATLKKSLLDKMFV